VWKIFPDKPTRGEFYVEGERYLRALNALRRSGARVVNLSIGGTAASETEALLFRRLAADGILPVAAMGNEFEEGNPVEYPAAYQGVLAVGAVDELGRRAAFSNTGRHIGLVAPGVNIVSTLPGKGSAYREETGYGVWDGTSMATPHVAAAAALVLAGHPKETASQARERLLRSATRLSGMGTKQRTTAYGAGLLNLRKALF
jgi:subtilisin family serine protease